MANTFTNIVLHVIFAVKKAQNKLPKDSREKLYHYLASAINERGHHTIEIGGTANHVHILFRYSGKELIEELIRDLKSSSTKFVNKEYLSPFLFGWQSGYACFSANYNEYDQLQRYIKNQEQHHAHYQNRGLTLQEELKLLLKRADMTYDNRYLFED